jgi:hypothetical protein
MDPKEFEQRLEQVALIRRPRPDFQYRDSEEYYDPGIRIREIYNQPGPCRYCSRQHQSGRYSLRRSRMTDQWIISCGQCRRSFQRPENK